MPWDGTELHWAASIPMPASRTTRRRGADESIVQPVWTAGGGSAPTSDRTGWWNVYRFTGGDLVLEDPEPLTPIDAEIGVPHWVFGQSSYAVLPDGTVVLSVGADGDAGARGRGAAEIGRLVRLDTPYTEIGQLRAGR